MKKTHGLHSVSNVTIFAFFLTGMFFGYIFGLWQQVEQKRHKQTCKVRRIIKNLHDSEHYNTDMTK